jgi:transposase-like protein
MKKRTFSAEFKSKIVLEVLRGEKEINTIAQENEIAPNQIRNWKSEFIENAALVFDNKKEKEYKEKALMHEQETDRLYKTIGQLTTQVDWLKKKSSELFGPEWESRFTPQAKG